MKSTIGLAVAVALLAGGAGAQEKAVELAQPFRAPYAGEDATGKHVIGLWQFEPGAELEDSSGNGHKIQLKGAVTVAAGRFGGGLESFRGWPAEDKPHQAEIAASPKLSPKGAFTIELWLCPKPEIQDYPESFLIDKRYVDKTDYQLILSRDAGGGRRVVTMTLGFGDDTQTWTSDGAVFKVGEWHHLAFVYDGAGTGRFYLDGAGLGGGTFSGRGAVVAGKKPLVIGDRIGSYYHGFPGLIDQVRLCNGALEFRAAAFEPASARRVFVRREPGATVTFALTNRQRGPVKGARAQIVLAGAVKTLDIPELASGERKLIDIPIDTSLRPDAYQMEAIVEVPGEVPYHSSESFEVTIVPRPEPNRMPVIMWGGGLDRPEVLSGIGFTHCIAVPCDFGRIWDAKGVTECVAPDKIEAEIREYDKALANGLHVVAGLSPGRWARSKEEHRRVDRQGKPYPKNDDVCGLDEEVQEFCYNVGASVAKTFGRHPAFDVVMAHTEVRGESELCFHDRDREAFKKFAGYDIPVGLSSKWGTAYQTLPDFPADRVIPDDYPPYFYYRWFWKSGDGWNTLNTKLHQGLKTAGRDDLWTFHDPAARVAKVYGSGGEVDVLSHWTYSYPDPIRIGLCTEELFCMAGGATRPDQRVMKMTQIIWYRSQTAPAPGDVVRRQEGQFNDQDVKPQGTGTVDASGKYLADWERRIPEARFITIAPMHLREALWHKISRPIQGIMYHGWQSLVEVETRPDGYRYTHPETKNELRRLVREVIEPLGPTLKEVPDRPAEVGMLESFSSEMFAKKGTYGWNGGWTGEMFLILAYAQLQPKVLFDETVQKGGLDGLKVLVLPDCDVLTRSVVDQIKAFQNRGGIVIGDELLCPAIQPDILVPTHVRPKEADQARALLQDKAAKLRAELDAHYPRYYESNNPDVITYARRYAGADYLFAVNDKREFGDYVGQHKLVMENGLPSQATLLLRRADGHVYDLVRHREVPAVKQDGRLAIAADFGPCEGRLYLVTGQAIGGVKVTAPEAAKPGQTVTVTATVVDPAGKPIAAIVPVQVDILDVDGRPAEASGYYAAKDGTVSVSLDLAPNDQPGLWRVKVTDLASGCEASAYLRIG